MNMVIIKSPASMFRACLSYFYKEKDVKAFNSFISARFSRRTASVTIGCAQQVQERLPPPLSQQLREILDGLYRANFSDHLMTDKCWRGVQAVTKVLLIGRYYTVRGSAM